MDPITVIIAIVVTFFCYMVVPFLYKISHTGTIDAKQANRFAIVNSVVVFLILLLILAAIDTSGLVTVKYISVGPAFLYYLINQAYLKHQPKSKQQGESQIPNVPPPVYQPQNKENMTAPMQAPKPNAPRPQRHRQRPGARTRSFPSR
jgi:glycerol uptake facilitator-like aquaporin